MYICGESKSNYLKKPKKRLGGSEKDAKEIKEHPFFIRINWKDIEERKLEPPFKPTVQSDSDVANFDKQFIDADVDAKSMQESLPWKKDIIYDGFTYKGNLLNNDSTSDELGS